jgi:uncharacterized SAM-binding protein YcdF (DUF218 family)
MTDGSTFILLTKVATQILSPLSLSLTLLLASAGLSLLGRVRLGRLFFAIAVAGLWTASLRPIATWAMSTLEQQYPPKSLTETPAADVAILLGGAVDSPGGLRLEAELNDAGDRILHAARLVRAGKVRRILVTGGNIPWISTSEPEAEHMRRYLMEMGVPADAIAVAGQSRNTQENAQEIAALWRGNAYTSALLVTSAAHMPRALAIFQRAGLPVVPSSTDVRGVPRPVLTVLDVLPDADALERTTRAMKEWLGLAALDMGLQQ